MLTSAISAAEFPEVRRRLLKGRAVISLNLCLQRQTLMQLNPYPKGTPIVVVNVTKFMAEETIAQLLNIPCSQMLSRSATDFLPPNLLDQRRIQQVPVVKSISKPEASYLLHLYPVTQGLQYQGTIIILEPLGTIKPSNMTSIYRGHIVKYCFSDI